MPSSPRRSHNQRLALLLRTSPSSPASRHEKRSAETACLLELVTGIQLLLCGHCAPFHRFLRACGYLQRPGFSALPRPTVQMLALPRSLEQLGGRPSRRFPLDWTFLFDKTASVHFGTSRQSPRRHTLVMDACLHRFGGNRSQRERSLFLSARTCAWSDRELANYQGHTPLSWTGFDPLMLALEEAEPSSLSLLSPLSSPDARSRSPVPGRLPCCGISLRERRLGGSNSSCHGEGALIHMAKWGVSRLGKS